MNKHFLAAKFRADFLKTAYFLENGYRVIADEIGISKSKLFDFCSAKYEKIDTDLFFTLCAKSKLKPLDYFQK